MLILVNVGTNFHENIYDYGLISKNCSKMVFSLNI